MDKGGITEMRLAAIYNVWADGLDLLHHSIMNLCPVVDGIIVVWSEKSNFGAVDKGIVDYMIRADLPPKVTFYQHEPNLSLQPHENETKKRNYGLEIARKLEYTHFLMCDSDEFYIQSEFRREKERIERDSLNGLVCRLKVLFKKPTLSIDDHTLVPFIQRLSSTVSVGAFKHYPFAFDEAGNAHIDPTRRPSHTNRVEMSDIFMYHASWVRSDYEKKIQNSSARKNLIKSSIYKDLAHAAPGAFNEFYRGNLVECENTFNLPEYD